MTEFDKVIRPGGVGKVTASFDTSHYRGPNSKTITVKTNDPAQRTFMLRLSVDVVAALTVSPTENPVMRGRPQDLKPAELTFASTDGKPFDVVRVDADPKLVVTVKPAGKKTGNAPGKGANAATAPIAAGSNRYTVTIAAKPDVTMGHSAARVILATSRTKTPSMAIHVNLTVLGELEVTPEWLFLRAKDAMDVRHVQISKREGSGLEILGVESSDPEVVVTSTPVTAGRVYDLTVQYTGKPGRGRVNATITVKTNEPGQSSIVIPISGQI